MKKIKSNCQMLMTAGKLPVEKRQAASFWLLLRAARDSQVRASVG